MKYKSILSTVAFAAVTLFSFLFTLAPPLPAQTPSEQRAIRNQFRPSLYKDLYQLSTVARGFIGKDAVIKGYVDATTGDIYLVEDLSLRPPTNGGNLAASNALTGVLNVSQVPFGTMTNGTAAAKTKALMDDTPAAEFSAVTVTTAPTDTQDSTIARKGTNSLKLAFASTSAAGDGVQWTAFASENWEAQESVGFWIYSDRALAAGDLSFVTVDSTGDVAFNIPAVATANTWTWVEVDISGLAAGTGDAVTNYKILLTTAGAAAHGAFNVYIDGAYKWDATEELTLGVDLVDSPGAVRSVLGITKANTGTHDMTALVEDTDYFVHSESGNDFLVTITDQSTRAAIALVCHK
jgi:hypothetical protein